jgi:cell division protein FtsB
MCRAMANAAQTRAQNEMTEMANRIDMRTPSIASCARFGVCLVGRPEMPGRVLSLLSPTTGERGKNLDATARTGLTGGDMTSIATGRAAGQRAGWAGAFSERVFSVRRRFATLAVALLAVGVGYHVIFGQNGLTVYQKKRLDQQALEKQMNDLTRENEALQGHVDRLQKDPDSIEHQAREELHYTRPGEVIYTLPPDAPDSAKRVGNQ